MFIPKKKYSLLLIIIFSVLFVSLKIKQVVTTENYIAQSHALSWDIHGYYAYLPALFIHNDITIKDRSWLDAINDKYHKNRPFYQLVGTDKGTMVNVYPIGQAIAMTPFFLIAHGWAKITGGIADGYSAPYQILALVGALLYMILGLILFRKLLLLFFTDQITSLTMIVIIAGTNLFYYASFDSNMPHIVLFTGTCGYLLLCYKWFEKPNTKTAFAIGLLLGWLTVTRPSELVWILVPLFWGITNCNDIKDRFLFLLKKWKDLFLLGIGLFIPGILQLLYWKLTTGYWRSYSHTEGFDFLHPFTIEVLFSFKKGWLVYTPLIILSIIGFYPLYKNNRKLFYSFTIFFILNLFIISSWECWWYAGSYSQRPFVQSYSLMAIPLGYFLLEIMNKSKLIRNSFFTLTGLFISLNLFQIWQLRAGILHSELMTKEYYFKVFGETHLDNGWNELLEIDRYSALKYEEVKSKYKESSALIYDFDKIEEPNQEKWIINDSSDDVTTKCLLINSENQYGGTLRKSFDELTKKDHIRVIYEADVFCSEEQASKPAYITFCMEGRQNYGYKSEGFGNSILPGKWCHVEAEYITPFVLHRSDRFVTCIWNQGGTPIKIDNIYIRIAEPK